VAIARLVRQAEVLGARRARGRIFREFFCEKRETRIACAWKDRDVAGVTGKGSTMHFVIRSYSVGEDLPTALEQLVIALLDNGFTIIADQHDEAHFGNRLLELANPNRDTARAVRLVQDRGLWSVDVEVAGKWRDPYQVLLALDASKYATRASSHEERLRFTLHALKRLPPASGIQPVVERLEDFDREYWRRLGVKDAGGQ
jgi:hypothetical protein